MSNKINGGGLKKEVIEDIILILKAENNIESAYLFGRSAKGNYKNGSDVDIALKGNLLNHSTINRISFILNEETRMPYRFDVVNYDKIKSSELLLHIDRNGQLIYSKT